jgi:hypothetical protein
VSTPYAKVGSYKATPNMERYKVYINDVEVTLASIGSDGVTLNTFLSSVNINSSVDVKIIDLTGELRDFSNSFYVYNQDVWFDIHLLYDKQYNGIVTHLCSDGVGDDYIQGSNYFSFEFEGFDSLNAPITQTIRVTRPRIDDDYTPTVLGQLKPFSTWAVTDILSVYTDADTGTPVVTTGWYTFVDEVIQGYESYYTQVGLTWRINITNLTSMYLVYLHNTYIIGSNGGCCGIASVNFPVDCEYNFEVTSTIERNWDYCSAKFDLIDVPCSTKKYLYKTSSSTEPINLEYYCDGVWKAIGNFGSNYLLDTSKYCTGSELQLRASCNYTATSGCCGNDIVNDSNSCVELRTIHTLPYCPTGEIQLDQVICTETIGCDDCGSLSIDRYITSQPITISTIREWNNLIIRNYHQQEYIIQNPYYKNTQESIITHPNTITYNIEKIDATTKQLSLIYTSNPLNESLEPTTIEYTINEDGMYRFSATITNLCSQTTFYKEVYVYEKDYIERTACSEYRLFHCIDRSYDLTVRKYKDKSIVYFWDSDNQKETSTGNTIVKYNIDFFTYDITFKEDDVYEVLYKDNVYLIIHDCFITNCHQEYIKSLLCETSLNMLLTDCRITDDTLLKTYYIQKYVLLYDVYKALSVRLRNIEYNHIITPNVLLEENYCVELYQLFDVLNELKKLCITCKIVSDDCGC